MHVQPGTVARSLLSSVIDEADPDAQNVVELLDSVAGAYERAQLGLGQARAGDTISRRAFAPCPADVPASWA
jgi:hypothetical protein